jgi:hypothetical protein
MVLVLILQVYVCFYFLALAYNDPNTDGAVIVQREVGDNLIILTIFAMQI